MSLGFDSVPVVVLCVVVEPSGFVVVVVVVVDSLLECPEVEGNATQTTLPATSSADVPAGQEPLVGGQTEAPPGHVPEFGDDALDAGSAADFGIPTQTA
jgi:hypothetical protein